MSDFNEKALESLKFAHEQEAVRQERTIKRLWIMCIILISLFVASNIGWIIYESRFEDVVESTQIEAEQSGDNNNIVGGDYYGPESQDYEDN